jgi:2-polyprenyl-3-methyl-5-hydroxy-6-metoxy-1,4-benzoquinol methylase
LNSSSPVSFGLEFVGLFMKSETREPQYQPCFEHVKQFGRVDLGVMHSHSWDIDPKHLLFSLSRYKFVAKMLAGRKNVLEVGCADAFASRLVRQTVQKLTVSDFDPVWIAEAERRNSKSWDYTTIVHDMLEAPLSNGFDGVYALDVVEHIAPEAEARFLRNLCASLVDEGVLILGTPSRQSQAFASEASRAGHVNCKDGDSLKASLQPFFKSVFVFSMNDEVIHTGFFPMAHYLLALCSHRKPS